MEDTKQVKKEQLNSKAVLIKDKKYILVSDRVLYFNETYPNGAITTELLSSLDADTVVMKATVTPDVSNPTRYFTGYSQATWGDGYINKTSALENCETSCLGRALGFMGIGVIDSIASVDEINKANNSPAKTYTAKSTQAPVGTPNLDELKRNLKGETRDEQLEDLAKTIGATKEELQANVTELTAKMYLQRYLKASVQNG